ncbi:unnamed protein product [Prunus armeniaca]|uniref:Uncharacterized protein n=1 Tax=Prunus armeniaca TaxID=36596 RepID=A0A6J5TMG3_PRUAR|nr:unnamed protein product [Prunus armeniaca]
MESSLQFQQEFEARLLPPWLGSRRRIGAGFASVAWGGFKLLAKVSTAVAVRQVTWGVFRRAEPGLQGCGLAFVKFGGAGVVEYLAKHPD